MVKYSDFDNEAIKLIRENVDKQIQISSLLNDIEGNLILDVAPQDHAGAKAHFNVATIKTLDIDPNSGADYIANLCDRSILSTLQQDMFDHIICTEVLEHVRNPFFAVDMMRWMLKPGGSVLITTPYNFRIHGPAPDCWRFTKQGLLELFKYFTEIYIDEIETPGRPNMPIGYTLRAMKSYED